MSSLISALQNFVISEDNKSKGGMLVMGNESCDLDSAVSSIVYSALLAQEGMLSYFILNTKRSDFITKTEVHYWLQKFSISESDVLFRDDLTIDNGKMVLNTCDSSSDYLKSFVKAVNELKENPLLLCLVDHHVLSPNDEPLREYIKEIIDHRPIEREYEGVDFTHAIVGSCSTLIVEKLIERKPKMLKNVAEFSRGPILVDTANCLPSAGRVTPRDFAALEKLEKQIDENILRDDAYQEIMKAKADVSKLSSLQILGKDSKSLERICVSGMPFSARQFIERSDSMTALTYKMKEGDFKVIIVMGVLVVDNSVHRDMALYCPDGELRQRLSKWLSSANNEQLQLEDNTESLQSNCEFISYFVQNNVKASRKQVMPILKSFLLNEL